MLLDPTPEPQTVNNGSPSGTTDSETAHQAPDLIAAGQFLAAFGKNGSTRLRAFPHKATPADRRKQLGARKFSWSDHQAIANAQRDGLGVYVVINDGGDSKATITHCLAYFAEFDGVDEAEQLQRVRDSGLPEPSLIVRTGGGSLHFYWLLSTPVTDARQWQDDTKRLIRHLGSDRSVNDPSRVMRLPGCWYMDGNQKPVAKVEVIHETDHRYTRDDIIRCLPDEQPSIPAPAPAPVPAGDTNARESEMRRQLDQIPSRIPGTNTRDSYLRLLWAYAAVAGPDAAGRAFSQHSPAWAAAEDLTTKAAEGDGQIHGSTFFQIVRDEWGITNGKQKPATSGQGFGDNQQKPQKDDFLARAKGLHKALDDGLLRIDAIPDVQIRSVALTQLQQDLGLTERTFLKLVTGLAQHREPKPPETFEEIMALDDDDTDARVEDLLGVGLTLLAADGSSGKTTFAYELVEAITNGSKFAGQFQSVKAPCLFVQLDESVKDARVKWRKLGFKPGQGSLTFKWKFSPMMFPELRSWVQETGAKVIVLDSLLKVAGGTGINPKDAEFGLLIYRLNQLAAELGVCIICIHHLTKADRNGKKRLEVEKEDIYGTAYVFNGAADVWGYWRFREDGNPDPLFALKCLKNRSGVVEIGTTYEFIGSEEDHRLSYRGMAGRTATLNQIKQARERIRAFLAGRPGKPFDPSDIQSTLDIGSIAYTKRLCAELYAARCGIDRMQAPAAGGRPGYRYFGVPAGGAAPRAYAHGVEKSKSPRNARKAPQRQGGAFLPLSDPEAQEGREPAEGSLPFSTPEGTFLPPSLPEPSTGTPDPTSQSQPGERGERESRERDEMDGYGGFSTESRTTREESSPLALTPTVRSVLAAGGDPDLLAQKLSFELSQDITADQVQDALDRIDQEEPF